MKHSNADIIKLLDRFCAQANARYSPESLKAGREILALPPEDQRRVFLALFGCLNKRVADYFSSARWGTGNEALKHADTEWSLERLFQKLAMMPLPMTDADFCAIIASTDGYGTFDSHFDGLLTLMESALKGRAISQTLKRWLEKMREAVDNVYQCVSKIEKKELKAEMDRIDALLKRAPQNDKLHTDQEYKEAEAQRKRKRRRRQGDKPLRRSDLPIHVTTMKLGSHTGLEFNGQRSEPGAIYEDGHFEKCRFAGGVLSLASESEVFNPAGRCTVRRVVLTGCVIGYPLVGPAIFEDVTIDRLDTERDPLFIRGAAFNHVTLKGNIGRLILRAHASAMPVEQNDRALMKANLKYYKKVDWALDIREARAKELGICSVPVDLVRYDPEHQAVVRLEQIQNRWEEIKRVCADSLFAYAMAHLFEDPYCDGVVLCTALRGNRDKAAADTALIKRLRTLGIADPA